MLEPETVGELPEGEPFHITARVFSRAGVDGAHTEVGGIEVFMEPEGQDPDRIDDGTRTLLLTQECREELRESVAVLLDGMHVDPHNPTSHPQVAAVHT